MIYASKHAGKIFHHDFRTQTLLTPADLKGFSDDMVGVDSNLLVVPGEPASSGAPGNSFNWLVGCY